MMQGENEMDLFLDKIALAMAVLKKESDMISYYNVVIKKIRQGYFNKDNIIMTEDYARAWELVNEIFMFLKHNKMEEIKGMDDGKTKLNEIMLRYNNVNEGIQFDDLPVAMDLTCKIISKSGYHEDKLKKFEIDDEPMYW